jgi:hypothetical protein
MNAPARIELDPSKLLGFRQGSLDRAGRLTRQPARVGSIIVTPEPSTWAQIALAALIFGLVFLRRSFRAKKSGLNPAAALPAEAGAEGGSPRHD